MDYSDFDIADFAADPDFVYYTIHTGKESDAFWERMFLKYPEKRQAIEEAKLSVLLIESESSMMDEEKKSVLWDQIQNQTFRNDLIQYPFFQPIKEKQIQLLGKKSHFFRPWYRVAAIFLFCIGISYLALHLTSPDAPKNIVVKNESGEKSKVDLQDGTVVWLNAASSLTYPSSFEKEENRTVKLEGEAFFDVVNDPGKPFIVETSQLSIRVLGTAFNVKSFTDENIIEATLVRGSIMIEMNEEQDIEKEAPVILKENQQAVFSKASKELKLLEVEAQNIASWKEGKLMFNNLSFSEIEKELERWYGVEINVDSLSNTDCKFSTSIHNEPITKILDLFQSTGDFTYEVTIDNKIIMKGELCK